MKASYYIEGKEEIELPEPDDHPGSKHIILNADSQPERVFQKMVQCKRTETGLEKTLGWSEVPLNEAFTHLLPLTHSMIQDIW